MSMDWQYEAAEDLDENLAERLRRFPREPDMLVYGLRLFAALIVRVWLRAYHRLQVRGRERLPASGSFVLVANHTAHAEDVGQRGSQSPQVIAVRRRPIGHQAASFPNEG